MIGIFTDSRRATGYLLHSSLPLCRRHSESFHSADSAFESSFYDGGHISLLDNRCRRAYYDSRVRGGIESVSIIKESLIKSAQIDMLHVIRSS